MSLIKISKLHAVLKVSYKDVYNYPAVDNHQIVQYETEDNINPLSSATYANLCNSKFTIPM